MPYNEDNIMTVTSQNLEAIASNVATIARESALILEKGQSTIIRETIGGVNSFTNADIATLGKKLIANAGSVFNYENYIMNASSSYITPLGTQYQRPVGNALPIIFLDGDVSAMSKENKVELSYKFGRTNGAYTEGTCNCKYQGNTTWNTPKHNYSLTKMSTKIDVGWGGQKKYVLKGDYADASGSRNVVSAKLWGDVVRSRTGNDALLAKIKATPNCCAINGFPCMMVLNGVYRGVYNFCIPKDQWMMNMGDGSSEAILQCDSGGTAQNFKEPLTQTTLDTEDFSMTVEYVPDEDNTAWVVTSWNRLYNAVINNHNNANYLAAVSPYVYIDNAIDYYIYTCLIGGWDGIAHNFLFSTYDGTKWFYTPYDLDHTFGMAWMHDSRGFGRHLLAADSTPSFAQYSSRDNLMYLLYTYSKSALKSRYLELRNGVMSEMNVSFRFADYLSSTPERCREAETTLYPTQYWTHGEHLATINEWYRNRCAFLDKEVASWNV